MAESIFVHGAGGFIGAHLLRALASRNFPVIAASRNAFAAPANVKVHVGELRETEQFLPLVAASNIIVHLASTSTPASTAGDPLAELDANLHSTLSLLRALQARPDVHLVYVSSGGNLYPNQAGAVTESLPTSPRSYHGAGKAAAEQFVIAWCAQYGARATILRPSNVYGPGQEERTGFAIVPTAMRCIIRDEPLTIWGDGSAERDYLYIDDFIALCLAVLDDTRSSACDILNAASGISTRLHDLLAGIEATSGRQLRREYAAPRTVDAKHINIDPGAAAIRYGWSAKVGLHDGLSRTWAWMKPRTN